MAVVQLVQVQSLGAIEEFLVAGATAGDQLLDAELTEKLLALPGRAAPLPKVDASPLAANRMQGATSEQTPLDFTAATVPIPASLQAILDHQRTNAMGHIEQRNLSLFSEETEKLDAWADDLKVGLEREIKELDRGIKEARGNSKGAATLAEKLAAQKSQRDLEAQRDRKRRELFARQDEIQVRRDSLIDELEKQLQRQVTERQILAVEWEML